MGKYIDEAEKCTQCGLCQSNCSMLSKYGINIGDIEKLRELAYHCFLCGECARVCPEGINGKAVVHELREENAVTVEGEAELRQTYKGCFAEKEDYKFRNYRRATGGAVYFPGCNFPSLYPKTSEYISKLLKKNHGIGTVYDCCGKPIGELGYRNGEERIIDKLNRLFAENGITELITACPNCKDYLEGKVNVPVVDIYTKLQELGYGKVIAGDIKLYVPCPDRDSLIWLDSVKKYISGEVSVIQGVGCCGLGGLARVEEPELASGFTEEMKKQEGIVYTYCGSCVGNFTRNGRPVFHVLPEIMETGEKPDTAKSYVNRMLTKHKR